MKTVTFIMNEKHYIYSFVALGGDKGSNTEYKNLCTYI